MKLTIFAATGGIGRQLLGQAVAAGHDVTAVARNPQSLASAAARVVAHYMLSVLDNPGTFHQTVGIAS